MSGSRAAVDDAPVVVEHDGSPLDGIIDVQGGKHSFAHVLASAAVADEAELENVPANTDSLALIEALRFVFARVEHDPAAQRLQLGAPLPPGIAEWPPELAARSRNLFCLLPATLHHRGRLRFGGAPAGCEIGARPTDWYIRTMERFGAETIHEGGIIDMRWQRKHPARLHFDYPTMTGTVIALAAAAAVPGVSEIVGGTFEPSCWEQGEAMTANGRTVTRGKRITVALGRLESLRWRLGPDRIHAATLLSAGLLTRGRVTVRFERPLRMPKFIEFCDRIGAEAIEHPGALTIAHPRDRSLRATNLVTGSEPLFSSDWAPFAALLLATRVEGRSTVVDKAFVNRFQFLDRLWPAGLRHANVARTRHGGRDVAIATLDGDPDACLQGHTFADTPDIRGSAAVLLSALVADGPCSIPRARHLVRGYEDLPGQLRKIGVKPRRREKST